MAKKRSARRAAVAVEPRPANAVFKVCLMTALLAIYVGFLAHPINLTISDLSRHLKNGELFFQSGFIADTNLYAYTHPAHPFVNHRQARIAARVGAAKSRLNRWRALPAPPMMRQ